MEEHKIEETIKRVPQGSFTVLDFIEVFRVLYAEDWRGLKGRLGQFGEKRRYTVNTYLSNRPDLYSQKPCSLLHPFTRYSQGRFKDHERGAKTFRASHGFLCSERNKSARGLIQPKRRCGEAIAEPNRLQCCGQNA